MAAALDIDSATYWKIEKGNRFFGVSIATCIAEIVKREDELRKVIDEIVNDLDK